MQLALWLISSNPHSVAGYSEQDLRRLHQYLILRQVGSWQWQEFRGALAKPNRTTLRL